MRIRRKPWARPELSRSPFYIEQPQDYAGRWAQAFPKEQPLQLELGCGKGVFTAVQAKTHPEANLLAIDIKSDILGVANRNIQEVYGEMPVDNLRILAWDIERILEIFTPEDRVQRIYINFCNPWPKKKHKKKRLTYTRQLEHYKTFLEPQGEIWFKTDDDELFEESLDYFRDSGFTFRYLTRDLHHSDFPDNVVTEHERLFSEQGVPIKFLIAQQDPKLPQRVYWDLSRHQGQKPQTSTDAQGRALELVAAGCHVSPWEGSEQQRLLEERSGLRFYRPEEQETVLPFYPVPAMELRLHDGEGNYFGSPLEGAQRPVVCVNVASRCCKVADSWEQFWELVLLHPQWKALLTQAQRNGRFLDDVSPEEGPSPEQTELLRLLPTLCYDPQALPQLRRCLLQASGFIIYPNLDRAQRDKRFLQE